MLRVATELFPVPTREFASGADFRSYLVEVYRRQNAEPLTVVLGITKRSENSFLEALGDFGFAVERRLGNVLHLQLAGRDERLETYLTFEPEAGVVLFYTNFRKTEDVPHIAKFLLQDPHSHPLFLRPVVMQHFLDELSRDNADLQVTEFTARRYPGSRVLSKLRPSVPRRTFTYWGVDGLQVLEELRFNYGVSPNRLVIEIPETKFDINGDGWLTYHRGDLALVLTMLGQAVTEAGRASKAFDASSFRVLPLRTAQKTFSIPASSPVQVHLHRKLPFSEVEDVRAALDEKFAVLDFLAQEGSLFLTSDLVTTQGVRFRIKADERSVRMLPVGEPNFGAFMEFYQVVVNAIDPDAELVVPT